MARKKAVGLAVGHIVCPNPMHPKPTLAIIRMKKPKGELYGYCAEGCGMFDWILPCGQEFFTQKGVFWPADPNNSDKFAPRIPPADLPDWIRFNRAFAPEELQSGGLDAPATTDPVPPAEADPPPSATPPGDASNLAPPAHQRKSKPKTKRAVMPWEVPDDED